MLDIGLCMSVRNEVSNIVECLAPIADLFAQIEIIDTGSTDGTFETLHDELGLRPSRILLDEGRCNALADVRNQGFGRLSTPWRMTLDADERLDPAQLRTLIDQDDRDLPAGLFCAWDTHYNQGRMVEDYKLVLFRSPFQHEGLIHDTAQPSLRAGGAVAGWFAPMRVAHFPDPTRREEKERAYEARLACAKRREPDWLRYDWFIGYRAFREGRLDDAWPVLTVLHDRRPAMFPVESLNASMALIAIASRRGDRADAMRLADEALAYFAAVEDDFEVGVNFRLAGWLRDARDSIKADRLDVIHPYAFPY